MASLDGNIFCDIIGQTRFVSIFTAIGSVILSLYEFVQIKEKK